MKRIIRFIVFVAILLGIILIVDIYVDSYASIRVTYEEIGQKNVNSNICIGTEIPLSERKFKWSKILHMENVDYIILGSSRSMLISSDLLNIDSFYNASVSGGCTIGDYLAETYILYNVGKLPKKILIEISPSLFNRNGGASSYTEFGNSYEYMLELLSGNYVNKDDSNLLGIQIKDLLSLDYFKYNLKKMISGKRVYYKVNEFEDDEKLATQHIDGSYAYSRENKIKNDEQTIRELIQKECDNNSIFCCNNFNELDLEYIEQFDRLISFYKNNGIDVSFYLPPYEEEMYKYISSKERYKQILKVEEYIIDYSIKNDIQVYGSYNPSGIGLDLIDFYDAYHIKSEKVLDTLWVRFSELDNDWLLNNIGDS